MWCWKVTYLILLWGEREREREERGAMEPRSMVLPAPSALSSSCVFSPLSAFRTSDAMTIAHSTSASLTLPHHASATMSLSTREHTSGTTGAASTSWVAWTTRSGDRESFPRVGSDVAQIFRSLALFGRGEVIGCAKLLRERGRRRERN